MRSPMTEMTLEVRRTRALCATLREKLLEGRALIEKGAAGFPSTEAYLDALALWADGAGTLLALNPKKK